LRKRGKGEKPESAAPSFDSSKGEALEKTLPSRANEGKKNSHRGGRKKKTQIRYGNTGKKIRATRMGGKKEKIVPLPMGKKEEHSKGGGKKRPIRGSPLRTSVKVPRRRKADVITRAGKKEKTEKRCALLDSWGGGKKTAGARYGKKV